MATAATTREQFAWLEVFRQQDFELSGGQTKDAIAKVIFMALQIEANGGVAHFTITDF